MFDKEEFDKLTLMHTMIKKKEHLLRESDRAAEAAMARKIVRRSLKFFQNLHSGKTGFMAQFNLAMLTELLSRYNDRFKYVLY